MKKLYYLMIMFTVGIIAISCSKDDDGIEAINPEDVKSFLFDSEGTPYWNDADTLSAEAQECIKKDVIGYGWKRTVSYRLLSDGRLNNIDFYKEIVGGKLHGIYFESDQLYTRYETVVAFDRNPLHAIQFKINLDYPTGIVSLSDSQKIALRFLSTSIQDRKIYLYALEKVDDNTWVFHQFIRMTENELETYKKNYL